MTKPGSGWHRKNPQSPAALARAREYRTPRYKQARLAVKQQVDAGHAHCWRCGGAILPGSNWHLGHADNDRTRIMGAEHAGCNLRAAASKGAQIANARRHRTSSRPW